MKWDSIQEPWNNSLNTAQFSSTHVGTFDRSAGMKPALSISTLGAPEELPPTAGTHPRPPLRAHSISCASASKFEDGLVLPGCL